MRFYYFTASLVRTAIFVFGKSSVELTEIFHGKHLSVCTVDTLCDIRKGIFLRRQTKKRVWDSFDTTDFCHLHNKILHLGQGGVLIRLRLENISGRIVNKRQARGVLS